MTQTRPDAPSASSRGPARGGGPFGRIARFLREVVAEMAKVIYPSRKELITYTIVVIVFVSIMIAIVAGLDIGFAKIVLWAFG